MATPAELSDPGRTTTESDPPAAEIAESGPPSADRGDTTIVEQVVHKIVSAVCREVVGIYAADRPDAITVQKGERQAAADLTVVVDYGVAIVDVTRALRRAVIEAVEHGTGLEVTEVNIQVSDVRLPGGSHVIPAPVARLG